MIVQLSEYIKNHWIVHLQCMGQGQRKSDRPVAIVLFQESKQTRKSNLRYWWTMSDLVSSSQNSPGTDGELCTTKWSNWKRHITFFVHIHGPAETRAKISLYEKTPWVPLLLCVFKIILKRLWLICTEPAALSHLISLVAESAAGQT